MRGIEWVQACRVHSKRKQLTYCYVQLDGDHIGVRSCTCGEAVSGTCPIDYHRHLYAQRHPVFALAEKRKQAQSVTTDIRKGKREAHR